MQRKEYPWQSLFFGPDVVNREFDNLIFSNECDNNQSLTFTALCQRMRTIDKIEEPHSVLFQFRQRQFHDWPFKNEHRQQLHRANELLFRFPGAYEPVYKAVNEAEEARIFAIAGAIGSDFGDSGPASHPSLTFEQRIRLIEALPGGQDILEKARSHVDPDDEIKRWFWSGGDY